MTTVHRHASSLTHSLTQHARTIILVTIARVSSSSSSSFEFSGSILVVSISGCPTMTQLHHSMVLTFCSSIRSAPSSMLQKLSPGLTSLWSWPSMMGSVALLSLTNNESFLMVHNRSRPRVPLGRGTVTETSRSVCVHEYGILVVAESPSVGNIRSSNRSVDYSIITYTHYTIRSCTSHGCY